jgi:beta-mannosidase
MKTIDLGAHSWQLRGWRPEMWRLNTSMELGTSLAPEIPTMPVRVPGSAQAALRENGLLPDWNIGLNSLQCEWVENRHWEFRTAITTPVAFRRVVLEAEMLDYSGWILVDGKNVEEFHGTLLHQSFDLSAHLSPGRTHNLAIIFASAPEEQGQIGFTSRSHYFKPRFSYSWDWCPRFVPVGIGRSIFLRFDPPALTIESVQTGVSEDFQEGWLEVRHQANSPVAGRVRITAPDGMTSTHAIRFPKGRGSHRVSIKHPALWWPNGQGQQSLYQVEVIAEADDLCWLAEVGFKKVRWLPCEGAPAIAEPWICEINGRPIFLQGINWTPTSLDYLSESAEDVARLISLYRELGCNLLRVWGGAYLESTHFYKLADAAGLMVWQEFPLSSSGIENWPPEDPAIIDQLEMIATDFVRRRAHHASLLIWCGGNELQSAEGLTSGCGRPCNISHPCLQRLGEVVEREAPGVRYVPTSPSGPRFTADEKEFGLGLHHDVHGPWKLPGSMVDWQHYWENMDALLHSEVGAPGAMTAEQIKHYSGGLEPWPPNESNLYWMHASAWWRELVEYQKMTSGQQDLEMYCHWSRDLQADALAVVAKSCRERFPRCGGVIIWMGHDCFPCPANTSIIDIERKPKPAYELLREVFTSSAVPCSAKKPNAGI